MLVFLSAVLDARVLFKSPVKHGGVNVETPSRKTVTGDGLYPGMSDVCAETRFCTFLTREPLVPCMIL